MAKTAHKPIQTPAWKTLLKWSPLVVLVLGLGTCRATLRAFKIPSGAMVPSLTVGDHIFASRSGGNPPARGEVIIFHFPENREQDFVKRAIALPGDKLQVLDGRPIINGWMVPRCYAGSFTREGHKMELYIEYYGSQSYGTVYEEKLNERSCKTDDDCRFEEVCAGGACGKHLQGPYAVAPNETWVMGDNRNNSHDSRSWRGGRGAGVPFADIIGSARVVWLSFAPSGGIYSERIGVDPQGPPRLLTGEGLDAEIEKCVKARPELTEPPR